MKKLIILLNLILAVCICAILNTACNNSATKNLSYSLINNGKAYEVSIGDAIDADIVIPSRYKGKPVTSIADEGFSGTDIVTVFIPNSVIRVGKQAFWGCDDLTSVTIGKKVEIIRDGAFSGCDKLKSIEIHKSNSFFTMIDRCLINVKTKTLIAAWEDSKIPTDGSVTVIGNWAFANCSGLTDIVIPECITEIGARSFNGCNNLINMVISDSVTIIKEEAFLDCNSLNSITIPTSVKKLGDSVFANCSSLRKIEYNDTTVQWTNIKKGSHWKYNVPTSCIVRCTDGLISI